MSIDMAQFHQVFFEESFEGLDIMESGLLNMDPGTVDDEEINSIFRAAHSIKGGSGTFGFNDISSFTHIMETLLDEMRDGRRPVTPEAVDALLRSVDVLRDMLAATSDDGEVDEERVQEQKTELEQILNGKPGEAATDVGAADAATQPVGGVEVRPIGWHIVFRPLPHMLRTGNDPLRIIRELAELGDLKSEGDISALPALSSYEPEDSYLSWDLHLHGEVEKQAIDDIFDWVEDDCELIIMPLLPEGEPEVAMVSATTAPAASEPEAPAVQAAPPPVERRSKNDRRSSKDRRTNDRRKTGSSSGGGSIRVEISKIDALINMVGELVITQSMLSMLGEDFEMDRLERLNDGLAQLERHTRELQESVMQVRMLPISFTFSRFPRLVHDLSSKLGKKIELKMTGENTEVDKTVIEKIGDPLVHLVRNSLDHGIEMPEERLAAGKPETGTINLSASHKGGNIVIEIRDDGQGLNRDKIEEKAIEKGIIDEDHNLSDQQIYELIFAAGFSTADVVSDVSGRGVGMDVVRRNINELGGGIEIESDPGKGSAIIIRLPLTLAILDGQTVTVADETYIVPLVSIIESIQVKTDQINRVAGKGETFKLRDEFLPILRLHELFGIENPKASSLEEGLLVVVEGDGRHCGLFVDDLLGQQQVVIKSLEANYQRVDGISGATILGDGSVALILDIPGLLRLAAETGADGAAKQTA
ncbi:MAG: chemotaxis protein CheA [gamma proteobacterium endosymbiont of Lamellibrachia anaximandri]|nr:chemotaxis protein CheA [gamma proteobacterium endosymbiont of Lamellibrachia anaximandri]MBL3534511.1 chemotaxis protein CheA [gamma proteobacterium endosymbiont of Lamellibrachia anaximandri]